MIKTDLEKITPGGMPAVMPENPHPSGVGLTDSGGGQPLQRSEEERKRIEEELIMEQRSRTKIRRSPTPDPQSNQGEHHRSQSLDDLDTAPRIGKRHKKRKAQESPGNQGNLAAENQCKRLAEKMAELQLLIQSETNEELKICSSAELQLLIDDLYQREEEGKFLGHASRARNCRTADFGTQTETASDQPSPGRLTIRDEEDRLRSCEIRAQIKKDMEVAEIESLLREDWPERAFSSTSVSGRSVLHTEEKKLRAVLVKCGNVEGNQVLKSLSTQVPVIRDINDTNLQAEGVIVAESKDRLYKEGMDNTDETSRLLVIGGLSSGQCDTEGSLVREIAVLMRKFKSITNQTSCNKIVMAIPENEDLLRVRKITECCLGESQLHVQICMRKRKKIISKERVKGGGGRNAKGQGDKTQGGSRDEMEGRGKAPRERYRAKEGRIVVVKKGEVTYSGILKKVKKGVNALEVKTQVLSMQRSKDQNLVIKIKGSAEKAEEFCSLIKEKIPTAVAVVRRRVAVLHISDLDEEAN